MAPSDGSAPPAYALTLFQIGPVARIAVFALLAGASIFVATMGAWMTEDSWLDCAREAASARCTVRAEFALHVATEEVLPPVNHARTEERTTHDKNGDQINEVLLLDVPGGPAREYSGVGLNGDRAAEVARGVNAFLDGQGSSPERWHLRESAPAALVGLMLAMAVGTFAVAFIAFRRVTLALEPNTRTLTVRRGRWPLAATTISAPLADAEGCAMTEKIVKLRRRGAANSTSYTAALRLSGQPPFELGISSQTQLGVQRAIDEIDARLALWRKL